MLRYGHTQKELQMWCFEPWQLAMMDQAGYNGIREAYIEEVAWEILSMGVSEASRQDFDRACWNRNIDPSNFT